MSRAMHELSARRVETIKVPGWYGDGGGLWLRIDNSGSMKWVFAWERSKRRREIGLGAASEITLATARELAAEARALLAQGLDPIEERRVKDLDQEALTATDDAVDEIPSVPTFGQNATDGVVGG